MLLGLLADALQVGLLVLGVELVGVRLGRAHLIRLVQQVLYPLQYL